MGSFDEDRRFDRSADDQYPDSPVPLGPPATHCLPRSAQLWFADNATGSWAVARYDRTGGPYRIRQHGPRRLWNEVETAYLWWLDQGKPPLKQWQLTISSVQQTATLT